MNKTKIPWCDYTWNPVTGCDPVSAGCQNCYARKILNRFGGHWGWDNPTSVREYPERFEEPFKIKKPSKIFACSMGDLFHDDVSFEFVRKIWRVMMSNRQHTFIVLTKRPKRMLDFILHESEVPAMTGMTYGKDFLPKNIWLGVSVENQKTADERIPILLQIPAAIRFVSYEPALDTINFHWLGLLGLQHTCSFNNGKRYYGGNGLPMLDWIIAGKETGHGARPCDIDWMRSVRDQCKSAGVPFFYKNGLLDGVKYEEYPKL